jgi:hypothetical protein
LLAGNFLLCRNGIAERLAWQFLDPGCRLCCRRASHRFRIGLLALDMDGYGDGEHEDRRRAEGVIPAVPAGRGDQRRVRLVCGAMRGGEDALIELARRLLGPEVAIALRDFRIALVSHRRSPP